MSKMQKVTSSSISEVGYNERAEKLVIRFVSNNKIYVYFAVKKEFYEQFINALSLGKFFGEQIKNSYATAEIEENQLPSVLGRVTTATTRKKVDYLKALKQATLLTKTFPGAAAFF